MYYRLRLCLYEGYEEKGRGDVALLPCSQETMWPRTEWESKDERSLFSGVPESYGHLVPNKRDIHHFTFLYPFFSIFFFSQVTLISSYSLSILPYMLPFFPFWNHIHKLRLCVCLCIYIFMCVCVIVLVETNCITWAYNIRYRPTLVQNLPPINHCSCLLDTMHLHNQKF